MHVSVLGPVEVVDNGGSRPLAGRKQRTVLALLAANVGKVVSVDALIDGVWGEEPTAGARSTLQTYVSNLRAAVGDVIVREAAGYRLAADPEQVDAVVFEREAAQGAELVEADPVEAAQQLRAALALWRGHPYADVAGSFPLAVEARRLDELRLRAVEARIDAELALDHHAELVAELEVLCEEFPFREGFRAQHMLALYRSGRQAEALRAFQKTRACLAEELGLEPSPRLQQLERQILNQDASLLPEPEPQVQTLAFLLTDVEDSTVLWELRTAAMRSAMAVHDRIVKSAVDAAGGRIVKRVGDGIDTVFADAGAAVAAAEEIQRGLAAAEWGETGALQVRMAVDVGEVEARGGDYFGPVLNRAGRMLAAGHGGQVLLSADSHAALAATRSGWQAKALGEVRFKGIGSPQNVFQLLVEGLPADFPPLRIDRLPPPVAPAAFGRSVRGYELREQVGQGDFGVVYRAYQPSVGREVAIKVIRPELVNEPSFVRGFEAEARLVAQLEHPHVVSLYDYWRDPDGAYLVMRWLRGGSLRHALERGPWSPEPAGRLLAQVASALSYAHRQGVVHRDLKPANVLLDEEGHAYLSDFGIAARLADPEQPGRLVTSSPAYLPPEALLGEPHTARSDLYGLGLLTFELLTGQPPPADAALPPPSRLRAELPAALDAVVARATTADPDERYDSVDDFLAAFGEAVGTGAAAARETYTQAENPYKGLRAFGEADADDFHGRDSLVGELAAALGEHRLVAVVGPSGIGKSSVVRAGLIPALRAGALPGSESWVISDMFPGSYPFEELAAALLRVAVERPEGLVEALAEDELGIRRVLKQILPPGSDLLLVVDQFEELFTLTADEQVRRRFLDGLTALAADARSPVRVVVTLRADFFDHPLRYPEFGELVRTGMVAVSTPSDDELAQAIQVPAERVGVRFAPGLVSQIVADVRDQPGALPLLQYALTELFAARTSDLLTLEGYLAAGGVVGALGRRAEELYGTLEPHAQSAARQVFLRLVSVDAAGQDTRRPARRRELRQLELEPDALERILGRYGEHRLLSFDREPLTRSPTVEVAHEALLTQWERLRGWIEERREDLLLQRRLVEAVGDWDEAGRRPDHLPREGRLAQFETWAQTTDLSLTAGERDYLGEARSTVDRAARRRARRRRALLLGFASLAAVASLLAVFAIGQREEAEQQARLSSARALAAGAKEAVQDDPELSLLLALAGVDATVSSGEPVTPEVIEALHAGLSAQRIVLRVQNDAHHAAWSSDGRRLAISAAGEPTVGSAFVTVIDPDTGSELGALRKQPGDGPLTGVVFDPSGRRLVTTHRGEQTAIVWEVATGRRLKTLAGHTGVMLSPRFTPDGTGLAVSNDDGTVTMWDLAAGTERYRIRDVLAGTSEVRTKSGTGGAGIDISTDGRFMATAEPDLPGAVLRRTEDGRIVHELKTLLPQTYSVVFSPLGDRVAVLEALPGAINIFDVASGELLRRVIVGASLLSIDWSPDGSLIAVAGYDAVVSLVEVETGITASTLRGHTEPITNVGFSPDGARLASAGRGRATLVWDLTPTGRGEVAAYRADLGPVMQILPSPDGARVYTSSFGGGAMSGVVNVLDANTGEVVDTIADQLVEWPVGIALSGDGRWLATTDQRMVSRIRDSRTLETVYELPGGFHVMAFSPDGSRVLVDGAGSGETYVGPPRVLDVVSGRELFALGSGRIQGADWSPDGSLIATAPLETTVPFASVYDATSGERLADVPIEGGADVAFHPDGRELAVAGNGVVVVNVAALRERRIEETATLPNRSGSTNIQVVRFAANGSELVTGSLLPEFGVWDASTWQLKYTIRAPYANPSMSLLASGREVVSGGMSGPGLVVYTLEVDRLIEIARERLTRSFTVAECIRYLHLAECPPT